MPKEFITLRCPLTEAIQSLITSQLSNVNRRTFCLSSRVARAKLLAKTYSRRGYSLHPNSAEFNTESHLKDNPSRPTLQDNFYTTKTLAVLPYINLSSQPDIQFFSDGLVEDLSKVPSLTVICYVSGFEFPQAESGFKNIADDLGAQFYVRGTIRQADEHVRINVSLIDPYNGRNLWAERYNRIKVDPFSVP